MLSDCLTHGQVSGSLSAVVLRRAVVKVFRTLVKTEMLYTKLETGWTLEGTRDTESEQRQQLQQQHLCVSKFFCCVSLNKEEIFAPKAEITFRKSNDGN